MSHRSKPYESIIHQAEADLRTLLNIPPNFKVLFLQGGALGAFAAVPLNLLKGTSGVVDYVITGHWGKNAANEVGLFSCLLSPLQRIPYRQRSTRRRSTLSAAARPASSPTFLTTQLGTSRPMLPTSTIPQMRPFMVLSSPRLARSSLLAALSFVTCRPTS